MRTVGAKKPFLQVATLWINSVYFVVALFSLLSIYLPKSSVFVWLFYRVYLGIAMRYFITLTMQWYQGEAGMIEAVGPEMKINFRVFPCCCLFCCPGADYLTKRRIKMMKGAVFQMPYVQVSSILTKPNRDVCKKACSFFIGLVGSPSLVHSDSCHQLISKSLTLCRHFARST